MKRGAVGYIRDCFVNHGWIAILLFEVVILVVGIRYWVDGQASERDLTETLPPITKELPRIEFMVQLDVAMRPKDIDPDALSSLSKSFRDYLSSPEFLRALERFEEELNLRVWSEYWFHLPRFNLDKALDGGGASSEVDSEHQLRSVGMLRSFQRIDRAHATGRARARYADVPSGFNLPVPQLVPYTELRSRLVRGLVGSEVEDAGSPGAKLRIEDVLIYPAFDQLGADSSSDKPQGICLVGIRVDSNDPRSSIRGWLYFKSRFSIDAENEELRITAISTTKEMPGAVRVSSDSKRGLENAIRGAGVVELRGAKARALAQARRMLDTVVEPSFVGAFKAPIWQLDKEKTPVAMPIGFDGSLYYLTGQDVHATPQGLLIIWIASGRVTAAFSPDEALVASLMEAVADKRRRDAMEQQRLAERRERERWRKEVIRSLRPF